MNLFLTNFKIFQNCLKQSLAISKPKNCFHLIAALISRTFQTTLPLDQQRVKSRSLSSTVTNLRTVKRSSTCWKRSTRLKSTMAWQLANKQRSALWRSLLKNQPNGKFAFQRNQLSFLKIFSIAIYDRSRDNSWFATADGFIENLSGIKKWAFKNILNGQVQKQVSNFCSRIQLIFQSFQLRNALYAQGLGRNSPEEVDELAKKDLTALSTLLGEKNYLYGDRPTTIDATLFGTLVSLYDPPLNSKAIKPYLEQSTPNLVEYMKRIKQEVKNHSKKQLKFLHFSVLAWLRQAVQGTAHERKRLIVQGRCCQLSTAISSLSSLTNFLLKFSNVLSSLIQFCLK